MRKLIIRTTRFCRRFGMSERGVAAIEFAMILPVLVVMCFATVDGGRALAIYMKLRATAYALAAITNQYPTVDSTTLAGIMSATNSIMAPYTTTPMTATVSQVWIDSNSNPTVSWSYANGGGTGLTPGASVTVPSGMLTPNTFLIYAQTGYSYSPLFGYFGNGANISLSDSLFMTPRVSQCVLNPGSNVSSCPSGSSTSTSSCSDGNGNGNCQGTGSGGSSSGGNGNGNGNSGGSSGNGNGNGNSGGSSSFCFFGFCFSW